MFLVNVIALFLAIFLIYYFLYLTYITYCLKPGKIKEIEKRSYVAKVKQNISVIVYSHNNAPTVTNLVEALKKQEYEYDSYEINVILDNCSDDSAKKLEIAGGARLWRINNSDNIPIGKNKAIAWLLERILKHENTNAFVFLNANCIVKPDFLLKINNEITEHSVVTGRVIYPSSRIGGTIAGIKSYRIKVIDKLIKRGRGFASLNNILDTDICAIRQDILEKVQFQPVSNNNAEVDYSLELNKNNVPIKYTNQLIVFRQTQQSLNSYLKNINISFFARMNGFRNNVRELFNFNKKELIQKEFILSLVYPSETVMFLLYIALLKCSMYQGCIIGLKFSLFMLNCYVLAGMFSMMMARISIKELFSGMLWACVSPVMLANNFVRNTNKALIFKLPFKKEKPALDGAVNINTGSDATVTNGKSEYPCKIESVNEDGLYQITFGFKNKKIVSAKHLRCSDALQEIIDKLLEHGYALKVCQNCGYFKLTSSGRSSCDRGKCLIGLVSELEETPKITYIWDNCTKIIPVHAKEYVMKQVEDKKL